MEDVKDAARLLEDTYRNSACFNGYVSIEVLPEFARDPDRTIKSAREIFGQIGMPNIMIKVPGTKEAPEAIRALTSEGINVNATLLFSLKHYEACAKAYIEGLKDRLGDKKDIKNVFSVASVFVSRIDTKIDDVLECAGTERMKGKAAVANSKMIYRRFKEIFKAGDFPILLQKGANPQRVLWASTSTKNPAYSDLKYVEELIGPDTINTMPPQTVKAFLDHGKPELRLENGLDEARSDLAELERLGIDIDGISSEIQAAGVIAFQNSFDKLIQSIEQKM